MEKIREKDMERTYRKEKIVCPYCGKDIYVKVPEPEENTIFEGKVICDECKNVVVIPILPAFTGKPIEL